MTTTPADLRFLAPLDDVAVGATKISVAGTDIFVVNDDSKTLTTDLANPYGSDDSVVIRRIPANTNYIDLYHDYLHEADLTGANTPKVRCWALLINPWRNRAGAAGAAWNPYNAGRRWPEDIDANFANLTDEQWIPLVDPTTGEHEQTLDGSGFAIEAGTIPPAAPSSSSTPGSLSSTSDDYRRSLPVQYNVPGGVEAIRVHVSRAAAAAISAGLIVARAIV